MDNEESFEKLVMRKKEGLELRQRAKSFASKERLYQAITKRIKTSFIGALDSVESHMSPLWESEDGKPLTEAQKEIREMFMMIRSEILDKGNNQIREMKNDLDVYEVQFKSYRLELPFKGEDADEK